MALHITLDFLRDLAANNNRKWFNDHRRQYEEARAAFEALIDAVLVGFDQVDDFRTMTAKDVIHRINRDVRFSADKSPYNTAMSAVIGPDGRKSLSRLYYIRLEPGDQTIIASGAISLSSEELQVIREAILQDAAPLRTLIEAETFQQQFGSLMGEQLKTAPRGFPKDHPNVDLLRYKEFMAQRRFIDDEVIGPDFGEQIIVTCQALKPLTMYFYELLGDRTVTTRGQG
ncbi:DUF2461 domain-containing protein [Candidatus Gracilibacteria bacterium]|nr:DUF2461 domain-containing protein [Candidatus Gracilibacteria bacterium]